MVLQNHLYESIRNKLSSYAQIPANQWNLFKSILKTKKYSKGSFIVKYGEEADFIGFICYGLAQIYYTNYKGDHLIKTFVKEKDLVGPYSDILLGSPSRVDIQCLEDSLIIYADYNKYKELYNVHSCWETIGRKVAEHEYVVKESKERLLLKSAEERWFQFKEKNKDLMNRISQQLIASYLGITPITLSRIKRKK